LPFVCGVINSFGPFSDEASNLFRGVMKEVAPFNPMPQVWIVAKSGRLTIEKGDFIFFYFLVLPL
jgi:hypothetical protein